MENLSATVGNNIAALRKAKGLTQQELANEIHYSDKSISKWELGYSCPSVDILMDFSAYFEVPLEYLVTSHEEGDALAVVEKNQAKDPAVDANRASIMGLTVMVIVLIAISIFLSQILFKKETISVQLFGIFPWIVPVSSFLLILQIKYFFHNRKAQFVMGSVFVWSLLLCFCFHFAFFASSQENIWYILAIGIPIQVIIILLMNWKSPKPKKEKPIKPKTNKKSEDR